MQSPHLKSTEKVQCTTKSNSTSKFCTTCVLNSWRFGLHLVHPSCPHGNNKLDERRKCSTLLVGVSSAGATLMNASRTTPLACAPLDIVSPRGKHVCLPGRANKLLTGLRPVSVGECALRVRFFTNAILASICLRGLRSRTLQVASACHVHTSTSALSAVPHVRPSSVSSERLWLCTTRTDTSIPKQTFARSKQTCSQM